MKIQEFGYASDANGLKKTSFSAFSAKGFSGSGYYNFFSGGVSASTSISFPNSDDQIISIEEIGFSYGSSPININEFLQITKNDKVILKIPIWELVNKDTNAKIGTLSVKSYNSRSKRLKNPIIINGTDNVKIQGYFIDTSSFTVFLRGSKFSKSFPFQFNEMGGKKVERNDFTLFHKKTVSTGSNILFASESTDTAYSKLLPLSNRESFVINAVEIVDVAAGLVSDAELAIAYEESLSVSNELKIILNNVEAFKSSDIEMFSFIHRSTGNDFVQTKYGTYVLSTPLIIPASAGVQVLFNSVARTKASTTLLFLLKGELLKEVM